MEGKKARNRIPLFLYILTEKNATRKNEGAYNFVLIHNGGVK